MELHVIKTEKDYNEALKEIDSLLDAPEGSEAAEKLELLSILIEAYEERHFKIEVPDPIEAIKYMMEQLNLVNKDLESSIGARGRVSEILNYKRNLTLPMIRKLNKNLRIPAEILIREPSKKKSA